MSHQDGQYGTTNAQDLQSVLDWLVPRGVQLPAERYLW